MPSETLKCLIKKYGLYMTVSQAAEFLDTTPETVLDRIHKGELIGKRMGKKYIIASENMAKFLLDKEEKTVAKTLRRIV